VKAAKERPAPNFILVAGVTSHLGASHFDSRAENGMRRTLNAAEWANLKRAFDELN
jgi:hypothetical protein